MAPVLRRGPRLSRANAHAVAARAPLPPSCDPQGPPLQSGNGGGRVRPAPAAGPLKALLKPDHQPGRQTRARCTAATPRSSDSALRRTSLRSLTLDLVLSQQRMRTGEFLRLGSATLFGKVESIVCAAD